MNVYLGTHKSLKRSQLSYHAEITATSGPVVLVSLRRIGARGTDNWVSPWLSRHPFSQYSPTGSTWLMYRGDIHPVLYQATCYVSKHTTVYGKGE
jgi:hypothetical protein